MNTYIKLKNLLSLDNLACGVLLSAFVGQGVRFEKVYFFHIISFLFLIRLIFSSSFLQKIKTFSKNRIAWFPILLTLYSTLTLFWSGSLIDGLKKVTIYSFGLIIFLASFSIIKSSNKDIIISNLKKGFLILISFHFAISLIEIFTGWSLPNSMTAYENIADRQHVTYKGKGFIDFITRPTSFFWNPNQAVLVNIMIAPFIFFNKSNKIKFVFTPLLLIAILFGNSRGAIITFSIFLLYYFVDFTLSFIKNKSDFNIKEKLIPIIIGLVISASTVFFYISNTNPHSIKRVVNSFGVIEQITDVLIGKEHKSELDTKSVTIRIEFMRQAIKKIKESPFFGIGTGSLSQIKFIHQGTPTSLKTMPNYWIEVATELGLIFLAIYWFWIFIILKNLNRNKTLISFLLLLFTTCIILSSASYFLPMWLLFALCFMFSEDNELKIS